MKYLMIDYLQWGWMRLKMLWGSHTNPCRMEFGLRPAQLHASPKHSNNDEMQGESSFQPSYINLVQSCLLILFFSSPTIPSCVTALLLAVGCWHQLYWLPVLDVFFHLLGLSEKVYKDHTVLFPLISFPFRSMLDFVVDSYIVVWIHFV